MCHLREQADKTKGASESCTGLDEAGNDLGDITLGFFLRQVCMMSCDVLCRVMRRGKQASKHRFAEEESIPEAHTPWCVSPSTQQLTASVPSTFVGIIFLR